MVKRRITQFLTAFLYNGNLPGFTQGRIWQGNSKQLCVPGLNCYSCPGALGACPIGSLQSFMSGVVLRFPFYVLGLLILFGLILGRIVCGWLCPFGLIQELLYKIPTPKIHKNALTLKLTYLKYFIGIAFVLIIPIAFFLWEGVGIPAFCKFICPAGTLEAAVPLISLNPDLRSGLGILFGWKFLLMLFTILISIFIYRPFCRFICPLGAWYGIYNKLSLFGVHVDKVKCIGCNKCIKICKMDCQEVADRECINCGDCLKVCPTKAISFKQVLRKENEL